MKVSRQLLLSADFWRFWCPRPGGLTKPPEIVQPVGQIRLRLFDRTRALHFAACGCKKLKRSLSELQWVSIYMLDEPCCVGRPFSSTSVQLSLSSQPSRSPTEEAPESRSEPELAAPPSTPGSVSMAVLCYYQVHAFGRPAPINESPRGRRQSRPRRSNVVFTPVTTHSSGREKVTVSRWCDHEWLS